MVESDKKKYGARITSDIPIELKNRLNHYADKLDRPLSNLIRTILQEYCDRKDKEKSDIKEE